MSEKSSEEIQIFVAAGDEFAHGQIVDFQAPAGRSSRVFVTNRNQALAPTGWQRRSGLINTVGVVAKRFVKKGALADRTIDENGVATSVARKDICLGRNEEFGRGIGIGGENGLTADDDDVRSVGVPGRRTDDVLKLQPIHARDIPG